MSCIDQYFADVAACDATFQAAKAACLLLPTPEQQAACLSTAVSNRQACEQAAYLRYVQCIGQTSLTGGCEGCGGGA